MNSKVKILRNKGVRRLDREIAADAGHEGELTMHQAGTGCQLQLCSVDGPVQTSVIPALHDARLVTMHGSKMLFHASSGPASATLHSISRVVGDGAERLTTCT